MAFEEGIGKSPIVLSGLGGLNTSMHPADISEDELSIAYNFWFEASSGKLSSRTGLSCVGSDQTPDGIDIMHSFIRKDTEGWLVASAGLFLYYFDFGTRVWVVISPIENASPSMRSFNGNLYIADGSASGILKWNGTDAPERLAGSPQATALFTINNRLIANSTADTELDAVYFSAIENDSFDTTTDGGLIIRAGYGDGQRINGFSAISKTLIVSKVAYVDGSATKKTHYGIDTSSTDVSEWVADYVSKNNAATGPHALASFNQDVVYMDTQGIESLGPTQEYGDIASDPVLGGKINNHLSPYARADGDHARVISVSSLAAIVIILGTRIFALSNLTRAFTQLDFATGISYVINHGDDVYLAGDTGYLYVLDSTSGQDEITPGVFSDYTTKVRFKMMQGAGDILLTRTDMDIQYLNDGTYTLSAVSGGNPGATTLQIVNFEGAAGNNYLYDAEGQLFFAIYDLASDSDQKRIPCRSKYRGDGIAVEIMTSNGGRVSVGKTTMTLANVGK